MFQKIGFFSLLSTIIGIPLAMAQQPILEVQNWRQALQEEFRINKTQHSQISFRGNNLAIKVTGMHAESLEVIYQKPIQLTTDFALDMQLKLTQIGRDDNGTGHLSRLVIQLGTGAPLRLGFLMQIIRDRYKVDEQYKIFRTDENWHQWHFEIRTDRKMIFLTRDGAYQCAHKIASMADEPSTSGTSLSDEKRFKSGFKIIVYGTSEVNAEIEIGEIKITPLTPIVKATHKPIQPLKYDILPGEWPMFRRDRLNSGHSPLRGNMKNPQVKWAYPLGGYFGGEFVDDVDGDGSPELLINIRGRLAAYRLDGSLLWSIPMEKATIYGMFDLDGDGQKELVMGGGFIQAIHVLDGKTGEIRYKGTYDPKYNVEGVKIAQLDPTRKGQQIVVSTRHEIGYCLSFENGIENGKVIWTYNYEKANFVPEIVLVDMDRDGYLELVAATYGNFFVYSGLDGSVKMHLEAPTGRNYGMLVVKDIDQDGYPDIIMLADRLREHIAVIKNEGGKSLRLLWDKFFEQNYPIDRKELRVFDDAVDDFDGDGRTEILYGLWDETTLPNWNTILVDAISGEIKYQIPNTYPINSVLFFPDLPPQLLLSNPKNRKQLNKNYIQIVSLVEGQPKTIAEFSNRRLITNRSFREYPLHIMKGWYKSQSILKSKNFSNGAFFETLDDLGNVIGVEFIQGQTDGRLETFWSLPIPLNVLPKGSFIAFYPHEINDKPTFIFGGYDNHFYLVSDTGNIMGKFPCGGPISQPITGYLNEDGVLRILVIDPFENLLCLKPHEGSKLPSLEWKRSVLGNQISWEAFQGQGLPIIVDLDLDGHKEILIAQAPNLLLLLDARGNVKKSYSFPKAPSYFTFGQFTGQDKWDLYISYSTGTVAMISQVLHTEGDGASIWEINCGNGTPAVFDLTGQNGEDILLRDLFEHRSLDGLTGKDIFPITQWCGYHTPIVVESKKEEPFIVWTGGAYSITVEKLNGEQIWWRPFYAHRRPGGVADVDGDGRLEIGSVTMGQLYNWPQFYPVDGPHMQFVCMDALTGKTKWEFPVSSSISGVVTADVDNDGNPEFIFGTTDGHLLALRGGEDESRRIAFDVQLPAAVGTPIITDLFGTGDMQILVGCGDGKLYCIQ